MPRIARLVFEEGLFHLFNRGLRRHPYDRNIFLATVDYQAFLARLEQLNKTYDHVTLGYCLMPDHYHLIIETGKDPLSKVVSSLLISYCTHFNRRYEQRGPLFEDRYKSIVVDKESYFWELSRYVHLNPVRAGLVEDPMAYPWSSLRELYGRSSFQIIRKQGSAQIVGESQIEKERYREFVYAGIQKSDVDCEGLFTGNTAL